MLPQLSVLNIVFPFSFSPFFFFLDLLLLFEQGFSPSSPIFFYWMWILKI